MSSDDLIGFVSAVSGDTFLKVEESLGDGFVRLKISEAERRQAKHDIRSFEDIVVELLRNSRDAHATRIFIATSREGDIRSLSIIDDGSGIPDTLHDLVFEPRVTSKLETMVMDRWGVHGRGMALFSIRSNVESARVAASAPHKGTAVAITSSTQRLAEKADQSTWPTVGPGQAGEPHVVKGPHNVVRRIVEFALEHPGVKVYVGSQAEVLSTMRRIAREVVPSSDLLFSDSGRTLPLWQTPAACTTASEILVVAEHLGLTISERTAHRIYADEIPRLKDAYSLVTTSQKTTAPNAPDIYRDRRSLRIHDTDLAEFRRDLEKAFETLTARYYLHLRETPKVTVTKDEIRVRFEIDKED